MSIQSKNITYEATKTDHRLIRFFNTSRKVIATLFRLAAIFEYSNGNFPDSKIKTKTTSF